MLGSGLRYCDCCRTAGLISGTPSFALARSLIENDTSLAGVEMPLRAGFTPVLHKEFRTEPHVIHRVEEEDYLITQLGMVGTATGDAKTLQAKSSVAVLLPYMCMLGYPSISAGELKTACVFGATEAVLAGGGTLGQHETVLKFMRELTEITLGAILHVIQSESQYTNLERSLLVSCRPSLSLVQRLCGPLFVAARNLTKPGDLLDVWTHEWKRNLLDPIPTGGLRSRLMWAWKGRLNRIDVNAWGISAEHLQTLADNVDSSCDPVWIGSDVLFGDENVTGASLAGSSLGSGEEDLNRYGRYLPLSMDTEAFTKWRFSRLLSSLEAPASEESPGSALPQVEPFSPRSARSRSTTNTPFAAEEVGWEKEELAEAVMLNVPACPGGNDVRSLLFAEALTLVLRLVRVLSITNSNVFIMGNIGNSSQIGIHLAASLCGMKMMSFDCKGTCADVDTNPNIDTIRSLDLKHFLKLSILTACGYKRADRSFSSSYRYHSEQDSSRVGRVAEYDHVAPQRVLLVVNSGQLLSLSDKQQLINTICHRNPCEMFDEMELVGRCICHEVAVIVFVFILW